MNFKKILTIMLFALITTHVWSLPPWAETALRGVDIESPPEDAEAWQLYDELIIEYKGNGIFEKHRKQLRYVVRNRGAALASVIALVSDGENAELERIRGWHRRPNGSEEKLDRKSVLTVNSSNASLLDNNRSTFANFKGAVRGSIIAFETIEKTESYYQMEAIGLLNIMPTAKRIIKITTGADALNESIIAADGWDLKMETSANAWEFTDLPGVLGEPYQPGFRDLDPMLLLIASNQKSTRLASWDSLAKWYYELFTNKALAGKAAPEAKKASDTEALKKLVTQTTAALTYRQRYLSFDRGWEPISGEEVKRFAYGDCKDMTAYIAHQCKQQDVTSYPALVSVLDGFRLNRNSAVLPSFNHVIAAILVDESVKAPAVVSVGEQRYLLTDATSKYTPFGNLPAHFKGLEVMICTPAGAQWVAVPDSALEEERTELTFLGVLDANFTFAGSIKVKEYGNSLGLRDAYRSGGKRGVSNTFAYTMGIPGSTDLDINNIEFDEDQALVIQFQSRWPSFMRRDSGGVRLHGNLVPVGIGYLKETSDERQMPLHIRPVPEMVINMSLRSAIALDPAASEKTIELPHRSLKWEASGGNMFKLKITRKGSEAIFDKQQLSEGIAFWDKHRNELFNFWKMGTLFDLPVTQGGAP